LLWWIGDFTNFDGFLVLLNISLGKKKIVVGPARNINLPYIIFNRARLHHFLVSNRNHAQQNRLILKGPLNVSLRTLTSKENKCLGKVFKGLLKNNARAKQHEKLVEAIFDIFIKDDQWFVTENSDS